MEKINKKIDELEKLLKDYEPSNEEKRKLKLITAYVRLAQNVAKFKSRVVVNKFTPKTEEPKPKAKRGRPKKKENTNVLATSAKPKTLQEKLNEDAK